METIVLKPVNHRDQECIGIYFEKDVVLQQLIQKDAGARWSRSYKCWLIPLSKSNYEGLTKVLTGKAVL